MAFGSLSPRMGMMGDPFRRNRGGGGFGGQQGGWGGQPQDGGQRGGPWDNPWGSAEPMQVGPMNAMQTGANPMQGATQNLQPGVASGGGGGGWGGHQLPQWGGGGGGWGGMQPQGPAPIADPASPYGQNMNPQIMRLMQMFKQGF